MPRGRASSTSPPRSSASVPASATVGECLRAKRTAGPALVSPSLTLPVLDGRVAFGIWQSPVLVDLNVDNPRRRVRFSFVSA
jgi:hypothetical protein